MTLCVRLMTSARCTHVVMVGTQLLSNYGSLGDQLATEKQIQKSGVHPWDKKTGLVSGYVPAGCG